MNRVHGNVWVQQWLVGKDTGLGSLRLWVQIQLNLGISVRYLDCKLQEVEVVSGELPHDYWIIWENPAVSLNTFRVGTMCLHSWSGVHVTIVHTLWLTVIPFPCYTRSFCGGVGLSYTFLLYFQLFNM